MGPQSNRVSTFKIFVSNLPIGITNDNVRELFEPYGRVVEAEVFQTHNHAFVHMEDDSNCRQAVRDLNGYEVEGNQLSVVQSKNLQPPKCPFVKLAVNNIHSSIGAADLRNVFRKFGCILEAEVFNGSGHVFLEATGAVRSAVEETNQMDIEGQTLRVDVVENYVRNNTISSNSRPGKRKDAPPFAQRGGGSHSMPVRGANKFAPYPQSGPPQRGRPPKRGQRGGRGQRRPSGQFFRPPQDNYSYGNTQHDEYYNSGRSSAGYYGPQSNYDNDFTCDDDDPSYYQPPCRAPQQREQFFHDDFDELLPPPPPPALRNPNFFQGNSRNNNYNYPIRIPRYRFGNGPQPLFNNDDDSSFHQDVLDHSSSASGCPNRNGDPYYDDFDHTRHDEMPSMHNTKPSFQPQPLMAIDAVPPPSDKTNSLLNRTAKVTKYGKIVFNNDGSKNKKARDRGGRLSGSRGRGKGKKLTMEARLSKSLLNPIPGTIRPVDNAGGYAGAAPPPPPPAKGPGNYRPGNPGVRPQSIRPLMPNLSFRSLRPNRPQFPPPSNPSPRMMRPMMRPPRMPSMQQPGMGNQKSMLALHHEQKQVQQQQPHPPQQQQQQNPTSSLKLGGQGQGSQIDFTADVEF